MIYQRVFSDGNNIIIPKYFFGNLAAVNKSAIKRLVIHYNSGIVVKFDYGMFAGYTAVFDYDVIVVGATNRNTLFLGHDSLDDLVLVLYDNLSH
jgi:hypothetical protein